jgi:hypothetical protein
MFAKFDRFEDEATARWVESQAPEMMESGAVGAELIIVPDCVFGAAFTWKRIRRAVDRAIIGNFDAEWSAAQDSRIRCGIRISGAGAIEVTRRIDGRKVCSVVGFTSHGICGSPSAPAELRELAKKSNAMIDVEWFRSRIVECKEHRRRFERSCRQAGYVTPSGRAATASAWKIPGTPEHRTWWSWQYTIAELEKGLGFALNILSNYDENCAGGVA